MKMFHQTPRLVFAFAALLLFGSVVHAERSARLVTGIVVDAESKPLENAKVYAWNETETQFNASTDAEGKFTISYPNDIPLRYLLAVKDGFAFDYLFTDETPGIREILQYGPEGNPHARKTTDGPFTLTLTPARKFKVRTLDPEGKPLEGIRVSPSSLNEEDADNEIINQLHRFKKSGQKNTLLLPPFPEFVNISDAEGWCVFENYPDWQRQEVVFYAKDLTQNPPRFLPKRMHYKPRTQRKSLVDEVFMVLNRAVPLSGTVRLLDGSPVVGCTVKAMQLSHSRQTEHETQTDAHGNYRLYVYSGKVAEMQIRTSAIDGVFWATPPLFELETIETGLSGIDFTLEKAARIRAQVVTEKDRVPVKEDGMYWWIFKREPPDVKIRNSTYYDGKAGPDGKFELILPPANYILDVSMSRSVGRTEIELKEGEDLQIDVPLKNYTPQVRREVTLHTVMDDAGEFAIPFSTVQIYSYRYEGDEEEVLQKTDENGRLKIISLNREFFVKVLSPDGKFGCIRKVKPEETEVPLVLEPTATLRLRLFDKEKRPVARHPLNYYSSHKPDIEPAAYLNLFRENALTDDEGKATLTLISGQECTYMYGLVSRKAEDKTTTNFQRTLGRWTPTPGEVREVEEEINPFPSVDDEYLQLFHQCYDILEHSPLEQRFARFLSIYRADEKTPLVLFSESDSPKLQQRHAKFFQAMHDDPELQEQFERVEVFGVRCDTRPWYDGTVCMDEARPFAERRGIKGDFLQEPLLCLFDSTGKCVRMKRLGEFYRTEIDPKTQEEIVLLEKSPLLEFLSPSRKGAKE